jgi:RHS repeat-associated protein
VEDTESFECDANGNLTKHFKPTGATSFEWNAYGKVRQVTTSTATMTFGYDAQQNRLRKTVTTSSGTKTTYYIRDAQGNALAVYEQNGASLVWKEQDLYGSSRLGMAKPEREVTGFFWASAAYTLVAGAKSYELSNHLGNVMAVISDRGELQSAQDFYPFGMSMPGRSTLEKHRYGFNGKETDPETGLNDFGARLYDNRLGRWLAVDPLAKKYPAFGGYVGHGNNPMIYFDADGRDIVFFNMQGVETHRVKSTTVFKTYVDIGQPTRGGHYDSGFEVHGYAEAAMPKIVQQRPGEGCNQDGTSTAPENTTAPEYQQHDYQIAASVFIFNYLKNTDQLDLVDDSELMRPIAKNRIRAIPDLDPTQLKALMIQETNGGVATAKHRQQDVLQINNGLKSADGSTDFDVHMTAYGFKDGVLPTPYQSIHNGIKELATKGFKQTAASPHLSFWDNAFKNHNGKGFDGYLDFIKDMVQGATPPTPTNYTKPTPKKEADKSKTQPTSKSKSKKGA